MRRGSLLLLIIGLALCGPVHAQDHTFGLGVIVGEPTGVCGKLWLGHKTAVDGAVAWAFEDETALHLHGDYIVHAFGLLKVEKGSLPVYYGIGGRVKFEEDDNLFGVRIPVGLAYIFEGSRVDLFLEVVPLLDIAPESEFTMNAGLGARYFF